MYKTLPLIYKLFWILITSLLLTMMMEFHNWHAWNCIKSDQFQCWNLNITPNITSPGLLVAAARLALRAPALSQAGPATARPRPALAVLRQLLGDGLKWITMIAAGPSVVAVAVVVPYQEDVVHIEGGLGAGLHEQEPILLRVRTSLIVLDWNRIPVSIAATHHHQPALVLVLLLTYPVCC